MVAGLQTDESVLMMGLRVPSSFAYYGRDGIAYTKTVYTEYEFNSIGDWVRRKEITEELYNPRRTSLTFRNIEYYEDQK
jgi:hypothetical protein